MELNFTIDPDITIAETPPGHFYTDEGVFNLLREKVFLSSWQWAASSNAVTQAGQQYPFYFVPGLIREPMVFTRANNDKVHLLSNVCTHRGNQVVMKARKGSDLLCSYHGRRFALTGEFQSTPGFEKAKGFPRDCEGLKSFPFHQFGSFLFAGMKPQWEFEKWIQPLKDKLGWMDWGKLKLESTRTKTYELKANWALYCDNYLEGFHIPYVHGTSLAPALKVKEYETEIFDLGSLQLGVAKPGDPILPLPDGHPDAGKGIAAYYFFLFPNLMVNVYPWGISINIVRPIRPDFTKIIFFTYVSDPALLDRGAGADLHKVEMEDEKIVERVHAGMGARAYGRGRYAPEKERGVHHFHRLLVKYLSA